MNMSTPQVSYSAAAKRGEAYSQVLEMEELADEETKEITAISHEAAACRKHTESKVHGEAATVVDLTLKSDALDWLTTVISAKDTEATIFATVTNSKARQDHTFSVTTTHLPDEIQTAVTRALETASLDGDYIVTLSEIESEAEGFVLANPVSELSLKLSRI